MKNTPVFSFINGYSFQFEDGDNLIEPWFSSLSGLEKARVNNALVAQQRNWSTDSSLSFDIQGVSYRTQLHIQSLFKGPFVCSLFKNGTLFKQQRLIFRDPDAKTPWYGKFWFALLVGIVFGASSSYFEFPFWIAIAAILALGLFNTIKNPGHKPQIEDVDIPTDTQ